MVRLNDFAAAVTCLGGPLEGAFPLEHELLGLLGRDLFAVEHLVEGGLVLRIGRRGGLPRPGEAGEALLVPILRVILLAVVLILRAVGGGVAATITNEPWEFAPNSAGFSRSKLNN